MRKIVLMALAVLFVVVSGPCAALAAQGESIAAVVNEDVISMSDVEDRLKLVLVSSNIPDTKEMRDRVLPQVLNVLVDEQLRIQEARKNGIEVSDEDIEQGFATIAQQNKLTPDQFRELLRAKGVSPATLRRQIGAQMGWNRFVERTLQPQVQITDSDVDARLAWIKAHMGSVEYSVSEIFLPVESPASEAEVRQLATKLVGEIRGGAPFPAVARQFSQAAGAAQGGSLGWVQRGQLADELDSVLPSLTEGAVSDPLRTSLGFHILQVNTSRATQGNLPSREQVLNQVGLERLDRLQRRYMLDLKASAFIENRV